MTRKQNTHIHNEREVNARQAAPGAKVSHFAGYARPTMSGGLSSVFFSSEFKKKKTVCASKLAKRNQHLLPPTAPRLPVALWWGGY